MPAAVARLVERDRRAFQRPRRERDAEAVRRESARLGVTWPSLIDNDFRIWRAFRNAYWPSLYLLDGEGKVVWSHVGELHEGTPAWDAARAAVERSLASL